MRCIGLSLLALLLIVDLASSQTVNVSQSGPDELPMFRPVLLGQGPDSLVNAIDTRELIKNGQKNAAVMFCCLVAKNGDQVWSRTYRGTAGSKLLEDELLKRLAVAKFVPATRKHE